MGNILVHVPRQNARDRARSQPGIPIASLVAALLLIFCSGCKRIQPADTSPLVNSGMNYDALQQLKTLNINVAEVGEMAKARQAGFSDDDCVEILKMYRSRNHPFDAGDAIAGLLQAGMNDSDVLELGRLNELGLGWGELQAMKLAEMSDAVVMEEARQRASGKSVLSGATLARLKNAGVQESTLLKLIQRAVPESEGHQILAYRRRGASEAEILRHFTGS